MITDFIKEFDGDDKFANGLCYWFAYILQKRYPGGEIIYDLINGHFLYEYGSRYYDVYGQEKMPEIFVYWDDYKDEAHKKRIIRDCILLVPDEEIDYWSYLDEMNNEYKKVIRQFD